MAAGPEIPDLPGVRTALPRPPSSSRSRPVAKPKVPVGRCGMKGSSAAHAGANVTPM